MVEYSDGFEKSIAGIPAAKITPTDRYLQERDLFGFFVNAVSTIENAFYCCYAIAAVVNPAAFPMTTTGLRNIDPRSTGLRFYSHYPSDLITGVMVAVLASVDWSDMNDVRNILGHRGSPGRTAHIGGDLSGQTTWIHDIGIAPGATTTRRAWVATASRLLVDAAARFAVARL